MSGDDLVAQRLRKLAELRQWCEPYGRAFPRTPAAEICEGQQGVRAAGRVLSLRLHGKSAFFDLHDWSGKIQVYVKKPELSEELLLLFDRIDIGDIVGVEGDAFRTRTGELTIHARHLRILSKSLRPLPEKWHGLRDRELRFRKRYLDLVMRTESRQTFIARARAIHALREFLVARGFIEVETPMMQPIPGGAEARPFVTHHNALGIDLYLRIAPELYLKRLLVGGFEKVFEINRNFRNEGISPLHNPEFTMLELYEAYGDCASIMNLTEALISHVAREVLGTLRISYNGADIDLSPPWRRLKWEDALAAAGVSDWRDVTQVRTAAADFIHELPEAAGTGQFELLDHLFARKVQPGLTSPTFVVEYPKATSPLAKSTPQCEEMVERFELFIGGIELANAYSELNDPQEQRARFEAEVRTGGSGRPKVVDEEYLEALEYGMPPAGGLGVGIDRLVMLLTGATSIREVVLFPLLRPRQ